VLPLDRAHLGRPYRVAALRHAPLVVGDRVIGVVSADTGAGMVGGRGFGWLCQNLAVASRRAIYAQARARERRARLYGEGQDPVRWSGALEPGGAGLHRTLDVDTMSTR
jgi:hypothetical protein